MLMCLVLDQRGQSKHTINLESQIAFVLSKPIKKTKPDVKSVHIKFTSYSADSTLCVVTTGIFNTYRRFERTL